MRVLNMIALVLVIVGGVNWGLVGLANINLVELIFGSIPMLERVVYVVVGVSALYCLTFFKYLTGPGRQPV